MGGNSIYPNDVIGVARADFMNLLTTLAFYAAISMELTGGLEFPVLRLLLQQNLRCEGVEEDVEMVQLKDECVTMLELSL